MLHFKRYRWDSGMIIGLLKKFVIFYKYMKTIKDLLPYILSGCIAETTVPYYPG